MNPRGLVHKLIALILVTSLTLGCNFLTGLGGTQDPGQAVINQAIKDSPPGDRQVMDQVEHDMTNLLREQGGARAALGDQADPVFTQIDQARKAAFDDLAKQAGHPTGSLLPEGSPGFSMGALANAAGPKPLYSMVYQAETWGSVMGFLAVSPFMFEKAGRDANGNLVSPKIEEKHTEGDVTISLSMEPKLTGSRMEATVTMTVSVTKPIAYTETTTGTMSEDVCPDAQGNVPLTFSFTSRVSLKGGGQQLASESRATGHVNDDGHLASFDLDTTASGARQPIQGHENDWGTTNKYVEIRFNGNTPIRNPGPVKFDVSINRYSSQTEQKSMDEIGISLVKMNMVMTALALAFAEREWTTGYCLELRAPELGEGEKRVEPNSETPFTVKVWHKFEKAELPLPVTAKLGSGQVSVNPSGSKVTAPANFVYKAPDKKGQKATVNLETRSKRGIATLDAGFSTGAQGWTAYWEDQGARWSGVVCSLDQPFTITVLTQGGDLEMPFNFTPADAQGGTVGFDVTKYGTHWEGNGPYAVQGTGTENLSLVGTITGSYKTNAGQGSYPVHFDIPLTPLGTNECGQP